MSFLLIRNHQEQKQTRRGGEHMSRTTPADRKEMAQFLRTINKEPKDITVTMANAFIAGMEAQRAVDSAAKASA